jgi:gamma-polyglutamate biosynthesis protein CapA
MSIRADHWRYKIYIAVVMYVIVLVSVSYSIFVPHTYSNFYTDSLQFDPLMYFDHELVNSARIFFFAKFLGDTQSCVYRGDPIQILFVGDMNFDRHIRSMVQKYGGDHIFSCIDELLFKADVVVGNLEGPITSHNSVSLGSVIGSPSNYQFTFPTSTATLLAEHNIRIVNLGNNHIDNFGTSGITETYQYLDAAKVNYFGGIVGDEPVHRIGTVSLVSFNQFSGMSFRDVGTVIVHEKTQGQTVVVFTHWGIEYETTPSEDLISIAHYFAEVGADAIIGTHPHVVIPSDRINGVPVYYSLGNFIFDQYWNPDVRSGLAVMLTIDGKYITAEDYPLTIERDGQTCPMVL